MAQPPLSQQISQFEEQPGTQLLVRTTRKVDLTAAGELLLGHGAAGVLRFGPTG